MFTIANMPILTPIETILYDLKRESMLLGYNYFKDIKYSGTSILTNCPYHADNSPSFGILLSEKKTSHGVLQEGSWHCFSCGKAGSLDKLVSFCLGYENDAGTNGVNWILKHYSVFFIEDRTTIFTEPNREIEERKEIKYISEEELDTYAYTHPYMYTRGLTNDIINQYDIGVDNYCILGNGKPFVAITFPVRDIDGNCLFVAKRSTKGKIFILSENKDKPIYGIYELTKLFPNTRDVYIVESIFNCLTLISWGIPCICLLGTSSDNQIEELKKLPYRHLYLALDGDNAGKAGIKRLTKGLENDKIISVVETPTDGTDINDHWRNGVEWFNKLKVRSC